MLIAIAAVPVLFVVSTMFATTVSVNRACSHLSLWEVIMLHMKVFKVVVMLAGVVIVSMATANTVSATHDQRPHVRIMPTDLIAQEVGPDPGFVTIQRTGRVDYPLVVRIGVTGTATLGGETPDFHLPLEPGRRPGQYLLTIPAGYASASFNHIQPRRPR